MKYVQNGFRKAAIITFAIVCLVIGVLTAPTPLPTGVPLIAFAVVILVTISATARHVVKKLRARSRPLDRGFLFVEQRAARPMATMLKRTRPLKRKIEAKAAMKAASAAIQSVRSRAGKGNAEPS